MADEDYGWLGVGGEDTGLLGGSSRDITRLMWLAGQASDLLTGTSDTTMWRAETGLQSLYLVLRPVEASGDPSIDFVSRADKVRTYSVDYDWYTVVQGDDRRAAWLLAGHLLLVVAAISEQDRLPLPALPKPWPR